MAVDLGQADEIAVLREATASKVDGGPRMIWTHPDDVSTDFHLRTMLCVLLSHEQKRTYVETEGNTPHERLELEPKLEPKCGAAIRNQKIWSTTFNEGVTRIQELGVGLWLETVQVLGLKKEERKKVRDRGGEPASEARHHGLKWDQLRFCVSEDLS